MLSHLRIALVCISIAAFAYAALGHWRAGASLRWPEVEGAPLCEEPWPWPEPEL